MIDLATLVLVGSLLGMGVTAVAVVILTEDKSIRQRMDSRCHSSYTKGGI